MALGVAIAAGAIAAKSIAAAGAFESSTNRLITSAGETHANIDMVRKGMLEMAGQVGDSAMDLSKAMYTIESGGQHGAAGLMVLRAAAEGAKAEGADLTTVADALTSVLQDYHLKASDAALVTSQMVAAVGAGKTTFEQFAGSLHSVLPIAQSAGISFVDVSAAIASMTVHGMSADQATQNLADTIKHMIAPTGVQTKELAMLGMSSSDLADMVGKKGLTGTLQDLSQLILSHMGPSGRVLLQAFNQSKDAAKDANTMIQSMPAPLQKLATQFQQNKISVADWRTELKGLPPQQANLLSQFATLQNQASGFNSVLKSGGPAAQTYQDALRRVTGDATGLNTALMLTGENTAYVNQTIKTISGATTEAGNHVKGWADVQSTFNQKMAEFKASLGATSIELGNVLLPAAKDVLTVIMASVTWFTKHTETAKILGIAIGGLAASLLVYKAGVLAVTTAQKVATVAAVGWKAAQIGLNAAIVAANFVRASAQIAAYLVTQGAIAVGTKVWAAAQWLLNVALDANPIGLIVIGIAALIAIIVLIATKTTWFQTAWKFAWGVIKATAVDVWHALQTAASAVWNALKWYVTSYVAFWRGAWNVVRSVAGVAWDWVKGKAVGFYNWIISMPGKVSSRLTSMWDGLKTGFRGALNWVIGKWNSLHFGLPGFSFAGISIPGVNIGVPRIPYMAGGGDVHRGGIAMVGEHGPEPVYLPAGASVAPHSSLKSAMGGGGFTVVVDASKGGNSDFAKAIAKMLRVEPGFAKSVSAALANV